MTKMLSKLPLEIFGFRQLMSPIKLSPCLMSSSASTGKSLLRLPVPQLEQTMEKYLKSVKPHLTNEELLKSKKIVQEFLVKDGPKLQKLLEEKAKHLDNWLSEWWLHSAYLDYRSPVVVFSNPGLVFPFQKFRDQSDQLKYATQIILAALDYNNLINQNLIKQEMMGEHPLDMSQYKKIFGTCRLPGTTRDSLSFNPDSNYIVVFHNGHVFQLPVCNDDGTSLTAEMIFTMLKHIVVASQVESQHPLGFMTSEHRDVWGKVYEELIQDDINKANLNIIEKSLFVVCLDKPLSTRFNLEHDERQTLAAEQTIHGGGSKYNSGNRWFDKTVQFIISEDGINGLSYEHSPAEGQPIAVLTDHIIHFINRNNNNFTEQELPRKDGLIKNLKFNLNVNVQRAIEKAKFDIDKLADDLHLNCFTFSNFGKNFIKSQKLSPDSFIQMAMQFAFYRLHKVPAAHYESAATRKYVGGRTETIRSCSEESIGFAKTMLNEKASLDEKINSLKLAIKAHKDYSLQAVNGFGVDRHLLGIKLIASENGLQLPKLYSDASFVKSSYMRISSSQVAAKCDSFMCYGPLVTDGYATCYNPRDDSINFATSAFRNSVTDVNKYRRALENSLTDMQNVLLHGTKSKL